MLQITEEFRIQTNREKFAEAPLWQCLEWALEDLKSITQRPNVKVDMNFYVKTDETGGVCSVCLAGASMANRLDIIGKAVASLEKNIKNRLIAISMTGAYGLIGDAESTMKNGYEDFTCHAPSDPSFVSYYRDPAKWEAWMVNVAIPHFKAKGI